MPELPEVETIAGNLRRGTEDYPSLIGREIIHTQLLWERTLAEPAPGEFTARIKGQTILTIGRRGKFLRFQLTDDILLIHLRMSGDLLVEPADAPVGKHTRLALELSGGIRLVFVDPRKFGRVWLAADPETILGRLGLEPLDDRFTDQQLWDSLRERRRQLKPLLLDQNFIAGLGNIYTDEALHQAGLHPLILSQHVTREQAERLWTSIRSVLQMAIENNGTSIDWIYRGGDYQKSLRVYGRTGKPCGVCGSAIERMMIGQRSTHFCPRCQAPPDYQD